MSSTFRSRSTLVSIEGPTASRSTSTGASVVGRSLMRPALMPGPLYQLRRWQVGKLHSKAGPQYSFPLHSGLLDTHGHNTLALALWSVGTEPKDLKIQSIKLRAGDVVQGGLGYVVPVRILSKRPADRPSPCRAVTSRLTTRRTNRAETNPVLVLCILFR